MQANAVIYRFPDGAEVTYTRDRRSYWSVIVWLTITDGFDFGTSKHFKPSATRAWSLVTIARNPIKRKPEPEPSV